MRWPRDAKYLLNMESIVGIGYWYWVKIYQHIVQSPLEVDDNTEFAVFLAEGKDRALGSLQDSMIPSVVIGVISASTSALLQHTLF